MSHESEGDRALAELAPMLAQLEDTRVVRPSTDPHAAAVTALLVADYLGQPDLQGKLDSVGITNEAVADLRRIARAIIRVVTELGGDYLPDAKGIPGDLVSRGEAVRGSITAALERALADDRDVQLWLEAIRLGNGVVDLVYDLRTLGELCAQHGKAGAATNATAGAVQSALAAADAVEFALRTGDTPEHTKARNTLARLWTLFLPAYDRAATAGRELTRGQGHERQFPPLALVASHRRARRRPLSLVPPAGASMHPAQRRSLSPRTSGRPPSGRPSAAPGARTGPNIPSSPALPDFGDVELIEAEAAETVEVVRSEPPPADTASSASSASSKAPSVPPTSAERESWSDTRNKKRHTVEIEVGIASQSNFYLGFTENLSAAGVFVATYASKPIGAHVEVSLAFPNGDELKVPGVVRWLREATTDGWPGMGVQFESLSTQDEAKIRKFLALRDPMFYDD